MNLKYVILLGLEILGILMLLIGSKFSVVYSQPSGEPVQSPGKVLPISKVSKGEILISRDGTFEGEFNTTYSVIGNRSDFAAVGEIVKSAIIHDFDKSPTAGYVRSPSPYSGSFNTTTGASKIANPFANLTQINKTIKEAYVWAEHVAVQSGKVKEIRCFFPDELIKFKCELFPAVEYLRNNALNESFFR